MSEIEYKKSLIGKEDLLLGFGIVNQTRGNSTLPINKINSNTIPYDNSLSIKNILDSNVFTIDTVDDFGTVPSGINTVIVKDLDRGGTFIYDATKSAVNNGGTIFDGWVRQFSGAVNVKWFGAKGDGVTDDTAAIRNAISIKGDIFIPRAVFGVVGLTIEAIDDFTIYGEGELYLLDNSNTPVIKLINCTNFIIDGLSINGNKLNQTYTGVRTDHSGIYVLGNSTSRFSIVNNRINSNLSGAGILTITGGSQKSYGYIANNRIYNAGTVTVPSDGMFVNSGWTTIENNYIINASDYGIAADYAEKLTITNNKISTVLVGIGVLGANFWDVSGNTIEDAGLGIAVTLSGNGAVEPYLSYDVMIKDNNINNITRAISGTPNGDGIFVDPSASRVSIIGNNITSAYRGIGSNSINAMCYNNFTDSGIYCSKSKYVGDNIGEYLINKQNSNFTLPSFNFGDSGINDEYLVICKASVSNSGIHGKIYSSRLNSDVHGITNISIKSSATYTAFTTEFNYTGRINDFTQIDVISILGTNYLALKARSTGGTNNLCLNFKGFIVDTTDVHILSRVRLSDYSISVVTSGFSYHAGISKSDNSNGQGPLNISTNNATLLSLYGASLEVAAGADNTIKLGTAIRRWSTIYAGSGTINTSDDREKTYRDITETETLVAKELKNLMKSFRFNDSIEEKGVDKARIHYGTSAQEVKATFEKHGLVAENYAILCHDEWEAEYEQAIDTEAEIDKEGNVIKEATYKEVLTREAGDRYGIRYEELICFIISAM